jgi:hypothetical protein
MRPANLILCKGFVAGDVEASMLFVTTNRMARFLREANDPKTGGTPEGAARTFGDLVARFGYSRRTRRMPRSA